jgi:hypothetical protein
MAELWALGIFFGKPLSSDISRKKRTDKTFSAP